MDDSLAEAHAALAHTYAVEWNWSAASHEFSQALKLDPNMMRGNPCHYVEFLMAAAEQEEAICEIERLHAARPLESFLGLTVGWAHYGYRDYDSALRVHQEVLKNDPQYALAHLMLGYDYSQKKRYRTAIAHFRKTLSNGETRLALNALGYAYALAGDKDAAKEVLNELKRLLKTSFASPYALAAIYAGLGEQEAALDYLARAFERRDPELIWLKWDPHLDNLRSDPRFQRLLNQMGLPSTPNPSPREPHL